jgi:D-glycero-alpha-D-manno-heptose 1-phosphate guanylyltransferase
MKAIILCGGLGSRLGDLTKNTPKPMLLVDGRPFISYVLDKLCIQEIDGIILACGFSWEKLYDFTGDLWLKKPILYSIEHTPLGTGGGILSTMRNFDLNEALIVNGDTLFDIDLGVFLENSKKLTFSLSNTILALKHVNDCSRYGSVVLNQNGIINSFGEKGFTGPGYINGGIYFQKRSILEQFGSEPFSFENDYLSSKHTLTNMMGLPFSGYFIDIGVPDDLVRANKEISSSIYFNI